MPADHAWTDNGEVATPRPVPEPPQVDNGLLDTAATALTGDGAVALFLGGRALREDALDQAGRIAVATGARLICETFTTRLQRGAGRVPVERLPYFGEMVADVLKGLARIVFIGAAPPVSFFAYPGKLSWLSPEGAKLIELARVGVADPGPKALSLLDRTRPTIDWVSLSEGISVPAVRADTAEGFHDCLSESLSMIGPRLIEAIVPTGVWPVMGIRFMDRFRQTTIHSFPLTDYSFAITQTKQSEPCELHNI